MMENAMTPAAEATGAMNAAEPGLSVAFKQAAESRGTHRISEPAADAAYIIPKPPEYVPKPLAADAMIGAARKLRAGIAWPYRENARAEALHAIIAVMEELKR